MDAGAAFDNGSMPVAVQHSPSVRVEPDPDDDAGFAVPIYGGPFPDPKSRAKV